MPPLLIINHTGLLRMPPRTGNPLRQLRVRLKLATCMVMPCAQLRRLRCPQTTIAPGSPRCQRVYARRENDPYRNLSATWNCRRLRPVMIAIQDLYLPMNICPGFPVGASTSAGSTSVCPFAGRRRRGWPGCSRSWGVRGDRIVGRAPANGNIAGPAPTRHATRDPRPETSDSRAMGADRPRPATA